MAEVWMVASGQANEGLNRVKLMFDNERAARRMVDEINDHRRLFHRSCDLANKGKISWDDVMSALMEMPDGTQFFVGQWTHIESFPIRSE